MKLCPTLNCIKSFILYDHTKGKTILELHQLIFDFKLCEPLQYSLLFYFLQPMAQQGPHLWLQLLGNVVIQTICIKCFKNAVLVGQQSSTQQHVSRTEGFSFTSVTDYK